ncbi:MAG: MogA/MoaB family molybdenum cofactor biosynthesis protein [Gemmatimonadota bacterium]|jgi:molybdopterin adenylyltransferase
MRMGVLTVSDRCFRGEREDRSGEVIAEWARERGFVVEARTIVADEASAITPLLLRWCDVLRLDLVLTTGGTGLAPRDVTPGATRPVLDREVPGLAEEVRRRGLDSTPNSILSRGLAGARGRTLLVNLPGSPGGVRDGLAVLDGVVDHACAVLKDDGDPHEPPARGGSG